jgi:hypothetical protein
MRLALQHLAGLRRPGLAQHPACKGCAIDHRTDHFRSAPGTPFIDELGQNAP